MRGVLIVLRRVQDEEAGVYNLVYRV